MSEPQIRFEDGATYENYMGRWSQLAGTVFLDWLAPADDLRVLDVGCGNGAFTERLADRYATQLLVGIDPADAQLQFARTRPVAQRAQFLQADAMALPFDVASFDLAVMPLVIFFVPEPSKGVSEMVRVVADQGMVAAYAWDLYGGGFPYESLYSQMREMGLTIPAPPSPQACRLDELQRLWTQAGLQDVQTTTITVQRTFASFDEYWTTILGAPSVGGQLKNLSAEMLVALQQVLQQRMQARLLIDAQGQVLCEARANAVKGRKII